LLKQGQGVADLDAELEHRAEKWIPVFRKNDAISKSWSDVRDS
jgi:hypothetical protein